MRKIIFAFLISFSVYLIGGCDKGIEPEPESSTIPGQTGFSGKVTFVGNWQSDIKLTVLVVCKNPFLTESDFSIPNISYVLGPIPAGVPEYEYSTDINDYSSYFTLAPGQYNYIVVMQSKKETISLIRNDWTIVGVYSINGDQTKPAQLNIVEGQMITDVNINVDFNHLPPQ